MLAGPEACCVDARQFAARRFEQLTPTQRRAKVIAILSSDWAF
jgi:hypothetical protein